MLQPPVIIRAESAVYGARCGQPARRCVDRGGGGRRHRPPAGTAPPGAAYPVPAQLDRADFPRPEAPWLFVLFSSRTCDSCGPMVSRVCSLESDTVATIQVEAKADKALHDRYRIEGVPMVVLADADGVVRAGFVGSVDTWELEEALVKAQGDPA